MRFDDVNGPRGGVDTICRIKIVMSHAPSIIVEERGKGAPDALAMALRPLVRSVRRTLERGGGRAPAPTLPTERPAQRPLPVEEDDPGSYVGRRVGRGEANMQQALARPEKSRRDAYVDTASPGASASDRRAGGKSTARRNSKLLRSGMVSTLEDSRTRPSRKSTRRSANSAKAATQLTRRHKARAASPRSRHEQGS